MSSCRYAQAYAEQDISLLPLPAPQLIQLTNGLALSPRHSRQLVCVSVFFLVLKLLRNVKNTLT